MGFDAEYARKRGLTIVTADIITRAMGIREIILRAHQSVSNLSTATTLLSEVQLRHTGHVVDSVHKTAGFRLMVAKARNLDNLDSLIKKKESLYILYRLYNGQV